MGIDSGGWRRLSGLSPAVLERLVAEMAAEVAELYPDPVDVIEDELARRNGLVRHPGCPLARWRRVRVAFLDGLE